MPRPINPANRYLADKACPHDGTRERFVKDKHCCECRKQYMREYAQQFKIPGAGHRKMKAAADG